MNAMNNKKKPMILVVDDDSSGRQLQRDALSFAGYHTMTAHCGRQALSLAEHVRPDLIMMDFNLPDLSGIEVFQKLKAGASTRNIPVVLVSAEHNIEANQQFQHAGYVGYVEKPYQLKHYLDKIKQFLNISCE